jgi:hypothetical protein
MNRTSTGAPRATSTWMPDRSRRLLGRPLPGEPRVPPPLRPQHADRCDRDEPGRQGPRHWCRTSDAEEFRRRARASGAGPLAGARGAAADPAHGRPAGAGATGRDRPGQRPVSCWAATAWCGHSGSVVPAVDAGERADGGCAAARGGSRSRRAGHQDGLATIAHTVDSSTPRLTSARQLTRLCSATAWGAARPSVAAICSSRAARPWPSERSSEPGQLNPLTFATDAVRALVLEGWQPALLARLAGALVAFDVLCVALATAVLRRGLR